MSLSSRSNQYGKLFGEWNIRKEIAREESGKTIVHQLVRKVGDKEETCALKAIPIISRSGEYQKLSEDRKKEYQKDRSDQENYAIGEVQLMIELCGHTNIVTYFDYKTHEWEEESGYGCDLLIRMELLHDLRSEIQLGRSFREAEVIQIGKDICTALVRCHEKNIIHRDIKPGNIFFNNDGDYKLGDFGISRIIDNDPGSFASTSIGTPAYIAPEQRMSKYDKQVDIYSLGLVLYELTNQNRLPFAESPYVKRHEIEKRICAKTLPPPCEASPELAEVILKACAHTPSDRYHTAQEMLDALNRIRVQKPAEPKPPMGTNPFKVLNPFPTENSYDTVLAFPDFVHADSQPQTDQAHNPQFMSEVQPASMSGTKTEDGVLVETDSDPFDSIFKIFNEHRSEEIRKLLEKADAGDAFAQNDLGCRFFDGNGVDVDYEKASRWFRKAADQGIATAMFNLGNCYYYGGHGIEKNHSLAVEWYQKAAENGNGGAQQRLGLCYKHGLIVEQNYSLAIKWYQKAAEQGYVLAMYDLGDCYYYGGYGIKQNYSLAVEWYQKAAKAGNVPAMSGLGNCYYYGHGVEKNYSLAVEWYQKAAEKGNAAAMCHLGDCYYFGGHGIDENYSLAVEWYRKAAEKEYALAMGALGFCYYYGRGVEKNYSFAVKWYQKGADKEDILAMYGLGNCHYYGLGVDQDYSLAVEWYQKAAMNGIKNAQYNLGYCYEHGQGVEQNYSLAIEWYQKAADKEYVPAMHMLGDCYFYGRGVDQNYALAVEWYQKAANNGDTDAMCDLGNCYYYGHGLDQNYSLAIKWYQNAANHGSVEGTRLLGLCYENGIGVKKSRLKAKRLKEAVQTAAQQAAPAPTPAPKNSDGEEDPFDSIFKIFNGEAVQQTASTPVGSAGNRAKSVDLFTAAAQMAAQQTTPASAPTPKSSDGEEDPFDSIFKIFNSK